MTLVQRLSPVDPGTDPVLSALDRLAPLPVTGPERPSSWVRDIVRLGLVGRAVTAAAALPSPARRSVTRATIAVTAVATGHHDEAATATRSAEADANAVADRWNRTGALVAVAGAAAAACGLDDALRVVDRIDDGGGRASALCAVSRAAPDVAVAADLADRACDLAGEVRFPRRPDELGVDIATCLALAGRFDRAVEVAHGIGDPWCRTEALVSVARAVRPDAGDGVARPDAGGRSDAGDGAARPDAGRASLLVDALDAARSVGYGAWRAEAETAVAAALADAGDSATAREVACAVADPLWRAEALLAVAVGGSGDPSTDEVEQAVLLGGSVGHRWWWPDRLAAALAALAAAGTEWLRLVDLVPARSRNRVLVATARHVALDRPGALAALETTVALLAGERVLLPVWLGTDLLVSCAHAWPARRAVIAGIAERFAPAGPPRSGPSHGCAARP